jgi:hypothetical protein
MAPGSPRLLIPSGLLVLHACVLLLPMTRPGSCLESTSERDGQVGFGFADRVVATAADLESWTAESLIVASYGGRDRSPMGYRAAGRLEQALTANGVGHDI